MEKARKPHEIQKYEKRQNTHTHQFEHYPKNILLSQHHYFKKCWS